MRRFVMLLRSWVRRGDLLPSGLCCCGDVVCGEIGCCGEEARDQTAP